MWVSIHHLCQNTSSSGSNSTQPSHRISSSHLDRPIKPPPEAACPLHQSVTLALAPSGLSLPLRPPSLTLTSYPYRGIQCHFSPSVTKRVVFEETPWGAKCFPFLWMDTLIAVSAPEKTNPQGWDLSRGAFHMVWLDCLLKYVHVWVHGRWVF